jgi:hypothetical protein
MTTPPHAEGDQVVLCAALMTSLHSATFRSDGAPAAKGTILEVCEDRSEKHPGVVAHFYRVETDTGLLIQLGADDAATGRPVDWSDPGPDEPTTVQWRRP